MTDEPRDRAFNILKSVLNDLEVYWDDINDNSSPTPDPNHSEKGSIRTQNNEAETRFKIIDQILIDVLEYPRSAISVEQSTSEGFYDYKVLSGSHAVIIEAKKTKIQIADFSTTEKMSTAKISGPILKNSMHILNQARMYDLAQDLNFACASNGNQWIFFETTSPPASNWKDQKAICFPSLQSIFQEFNTFYQLLSKSALSQGLYSTIFQKFASNITTNRQNLVPIFSQNSYQAHDDSYYEAMVAIDTIFSDISSKDPEMLNHCFVETNASRHAQLEPERLSKNLIEDIDNLGDASGLDRAITSQLTTSNSRVIALAGPKGCGKSTFIDRYISMKMASSLRDRVVPIFVNLTEHDFRASDFSTTIYRTIWRELVRSLYGETPSFINYRSLLESDYARERHGLQAPMASEDANQYQKWWSERIRNMEKDDPISLCHAAFDELNKQQKRTPLIILDNLDQFADLHDDAFRIANSLTKKNFVLFVLPITDTTLWKASKEGHMGSANFRTFHLPSPSPKEVISKRIGFWNDVISVNEDRKATYKASLGHVQFGNTSDLINAIQRIFVDADFITSHTAKVANFSVRRLLKLISNTIKSPHFKIGELVKGFLFNDHNPKLKDIVPPAMRGASHSFPETGTDFFSNIFIANPANFCGHYCGLRVLVLISRYGSGGSEPDKYISVERIESMCHTLGVQAARFYIDYLLRAGCIEPFDPRDNQNLNSATLLALSPNGREHLNLLKTEPWFVAECFGGLRVFDSGNENSLRQSIVKRDWSDRFRRFFNYFDQVDTGSYRTDEQVLGSPIQDFLFSFNRSSKGSK